MKIRICSDLHLEFGKVPPLEWEGEDVLVLAGDTGVGLHERRWVEQTGGIVADRHVVMIAGNHEFYGGWRPGEPGRRGAVRKGRDMTSVIERWRAIAEGVENFHFLESESAVIGGVRFLGAVLWTDFDLYGDPDQARLEARQSMNDFRLISGDGRTQFTPAQAAEAHLESRRWLERQLATPSAGVTVVVTHHCPSLLSGKKYLARIGADSDPLAPCFLSNLDHLAKLADLWVHGHTHESYDYTIGKCRVVCNPRGYAGVEENPAFDAAYTVDIGMSRSPFRHDKHS